MNHGFCHIKQSNKYAMSFKAISSRGKTWDVGSTLNIVFFNGTTKQKSTFKRAVNDIIKYANLKVRFDSVSKEHADIKVRFLRAGGNWSFLGTDALMSSTNEPTVSISNDDYGTCLHEACHAIGAFKHEHQNPAANFEWDEEAVIKDLSGAPNYWDLATIKRNVLNVANPLEVIHTKFDKYSIMLYPIPSHWIKNREGTRNNNRLSDKDKEHLMRIYPTPGKQYKKRGFFSDIVDWFRELFK